MRKRTKILINGSLSLVLAGCASSPKRSLQLQAKDALIKGDSVKAEQLLSSAEVVKNDKNRLLMLVELGTIAHCKGEYLKSNLFFEKASEVAKQLYTTSIAERLTTGLVNNNSESYVGMDYERSTIYYYTALNHLMLSQDGKAKAWSVPRIGDASMVVFEARSHPEKILSEKERVAELGMARSTVIAWDSFLDDLRQRQKGAPYYKDDMTAKLLAAYIHRITGDSTDQNTARLLYSDAEHVLVRSYSLFPTFNAKSSEFADRYQDFEKTGEEGVKKNFIEPTPYYLALEKFISDNRSSVNDVKGRVLVILETGAIPEKREQNYTIGLSTIFEGIEDEKVRAGVEAIGMEALLAFAPKVGIGLVAVGTAGAIMGDVDEGKPRTLAGAVDEAIGFEIKLPSISRVMTDEQYSLKFKGTDGKEINQPVTLVSPFNDIAYRDFERRASAVATKTGIRVGLKYMVGLIAAYQVYQKTPADSLGIAKTVMATATWMTAKKIIDASESADTRAWTTLPMHIAMTEIKLPPGKYEVSLTIQRGNISSEEELGEFNVTDGWNVLKRRAFKFPASAHNERSHEDYRSTTELVRR